MYRQCFCSGLTKVIAVNVGDIWELPRLSCLRWHILGICQEAGWGVKPGRSGSSRSYCHTLDAAGGLGGALRGRSPRTREGRIGPTAHNCSGQWLVVREIASRAPVLIAEWPLLRSCEKNSAERSDRRPNTSTTACIPNIGAVADLPRSESRDVIR